MKSSPHNTLSSSDFTPEAPSAASGFFAPENAHSPRVAPRLWLASTSPRRAQLLQTLGVPFNLLPNSAEEAAPTAADEAQPERYVQALARLKAQSAQLESPAGFDIVLAADTIVWHDGRILNKPVDDDDARSMLRRLRGDTHRVFTGVCLRVERNDADVRYFEAQEMTSVRFNHVGDEWIERYLQSGEPRDKAGAYAAQGRGAMLIGSIEGDYMNVVGLPLSRLAKMLAEIGAPVENWWI